MKNTPQQFIQESLTSFVGIPYGQKDCWALVSDFYKKYHNIDLPKYSYINPLNFKEISPIVKSSVPRYTRVNTPRFGDIVLIRLFGLPSHVGIYLDKKTFLHTQKTTGSIIDSLEKWEKRIIGFYKYDPNTP